MNRPYVICHMTMSIDGKVTGEFLSSVESEKAVEIYYQINRDYKADAFACGRITMEESFTQGWYPDIEKYSASANNYCIMTDCIPDKKDKLYAVAFDRNGSLGWKSNYITDDDPGYGGARIIEVLTEQVDPRYLSYLDEMDIPFIFAGKTDIEIPRALSKLRELFGIEKLLLEGGSIINGAFQRSGVIDELSLVVAPVIAEKEDKPLFWNSVLENYRLVKADNINGVLHLQYKR